MGILDRFFKEPNEEPLKTEWKTLDQIDQLDLIKEQSKNKPVAIFKHSIRCGISSMVKKQLHFHSD